MSYVDEIPYDDSEAAEISREHVQRRVDDWLRRLDALYLDISSWANDNGWQPAPGAPVPMNEEMMQRAGIAQREQPSLALVDPRGKKLWIKPKGLWVIGANGRVDLFTPAHVLVLIDTARQFEPAQWVLHYLGLNGDGGRPFTPAMLAHLV